MMWILLQKNIKTQDETPMGGVYTDNTEAHKDRKFFSWRDSEVNFNKRPVLEP